MKSPAKWGVQIAGMIFKQALGFGESGQYNRKSFLLVSDLQAQIEEIILGRREKRMAVTTFAAIDISSYEITMKIFEFSKKGGFGLWTISGIV